MRLTATTLNNSKPRFISRTNFRFSWVFDISKFNCKSIKKRLELAVPWYHLLDSVGST